MMTGRKSSSEFLPLSPLDTSGSFSMDVRYDLCSGRGDLWGGVALAAAMNALSERVEGMPVVFASAQFLKNKSGARSLVIDSEIASHSRTVAQGYVRGTLDEEDFLRVSACLGKRKKSDAVDTPTPLTVSHYKDCENVDLGKPRTAMHSHTELRLAHGMFGVTGQGKPSDNGVLSMWLRMPQVTNDTGALAILADYMLSGIGNSLGKVAYGVSLDNTIRFARIVPTDWIQCDIKMDHVGNGFGYGTADLFSEDGVLMATASQSVTTHIPE